MAGQYTYLFTPIKIGSTIIPNRIVFAAHLTNLAEDNLPGPRLAHYYAERARGGCGLIITEEQSVHPSDWAYQKLIHGFDPRVIPGYRRMTRMVHAEGGKIFAQINHNGMQSSGMYSRLPVWGPSPVPDAIHREVPKEMELEDIAEVIRGFALVATHVREGGFDGAELQSSHSSLIRQFFSPYYNRRSDGYGGPLEHRVRFALEVIRAVRAAIGRDFTVGIRLCGDELITAGLTLEDVKQIAVILEATGELDFINTSIGEFHNLYMVEGSMHTPPGYQLFVSAGIREVVKLPVFCTGRIKDPVQAERILAEGLADMVDVVRGQICDPEFARKAQEGRTEAIRLCISCNQYCIGRMGLNRTLGCIQTPATGQEERWGSGSWDITLNLPSHEKEELNRRGRSDPQRIFALPLRPSASSTVEKTVSKNSSRLARKRVMVIGGGPGGLEAAKVAARRGHAVTLWEQATELGGQVNLLTRVPNRVEFGDCIRNLRREADEWGVEIRTGVTVTREVVERERPDAVIVATGSLPGPAALPGGDQPHVSHAWHVLDGSAQPPSGARVVLVDQIGFHQATSVAELLAERGCQVHFVTAQLYAGGDLGVTLDIELWYRRVLALGMQITADHFVAGIGPDSVTIVNNYSGVAQTLAPVDAVILATPTQANDRLYHEVCGVVAGCYRIGDCVAPRRVENAILEGHRVGRVV
jgi:2,4-dienoyl-CoA reductase-like NADH-dependent reductase (Old Yellow Enzyme family)